MYDIASKYCKNNLLIETKDELDIREIQGFNKIGIMAGASTPEKSINEVIELLKEV